MELNHISKRTGETGNGSNCENKPRLGRYLLVSGIAALVGCSNGVNINNPISIPGAPQSDAALTDANRTSGGSNEAGTIETGPNQSGSGVDGGAGFDGGTGASNQAIDGNSTADGGVTDDSGTPVGVTDGSAIEDDAGQPTGGVDGASTTDGNARQTNNVADAPANNSESGTDSATGQNQDGGTTSVDSASGIDSQSKDDASGDTKSGNFTIDGKEATDGVESSGEVGHTDSAASHDSHIVVAEDASPQPIICNGQSAGVFKGEMNLDQQVPVGGLTFTYKGLIVTDAGASMYVVEVSCGNSKTSTTLTGGPNTVGKGITIDLSSGGRSAVFATITVDEIQSQDGGSDAVSPGGAIDADLSEGGSCTASEVYKDYMNLDQPLQYGSWTITYKGIVATDGGASAYDISVGSENGATTNHILPDGVSIIPLGDALMSLDLSSGGRSAVFATINVTCP